MRWIVLALVVLSGCSTTPEVKTEPPQPNPTPVQCAVPAGNTEIEQGPVKPTGDLTQRDVAQYLTALHQWGTRGWAKLVAVREWSDDCVDRETVRTSPGSG